MRVLLVQAPSVEGPAAEVVAPLGLAAVAAAARAHGHRVALLDMNAVENPYVELRDALGRAEPQLVGVGLRNIDPLANRRHSYLPAFAAVLDTVRRTRPAVPVAVGGAGFSLFPAALMERYPELDLGVVLERGVPPEALAGLSGTLIRDPAGSLVAGPARSRLGAEKIEPVRRWLPELVAGYRGRSSYAPAAGIETKRGCPLGCSYCVYPSLQGRTLRFRSPAAIVAEVELLKAEAGVEWVHFTDPVLNLPPGHFRELCELLVARRTGVRWTGFFREDCLSAEDAQLAVRAGCAAFQFSGDGTCDRSLARLRKGLTRADLLRAAGHVAATDALTVYHFMVNVPGTDAEVAGSARELVNRLHELHEPRGNLGAVVFNNLRVYPGTPLCRELVRSGVLDPADPLLHPCYHDPRPFRHLRYELEEQHARRASRWSPREPDRGAAP